MDYLVRQCRQDFWQREKVERGIQAWMPGDGEQTRHTGEEATATSHVAARRLIDMG